MNYKKIYESNLKENLSEPELMSETLKKISEWAGSIWELKELPKEDLVEVEKDKKIYELKDESQFTIYKEGKI